MARRILSEWETTPITMPLSRFLKLLDSLPVRSRVCAIDKTCLCKASDLIDPKFGYWCLKKTGDGQYVDLIEPADSYTNEDLITAAPEQWPTYENGEYYHIDDCGIIIFIPADNDKQKMVPIFMVSAYIGFIVIDDITKKEEGDE